MSSNFREKLELRHKRTAAIRKAVADVRAEFRNQSRQRVRQALEARLDGLGVNPPVSAAVLDGIVDSIIADESACETGRRVVLGIANDIRRAVQAFDALRDPDAQHGLNMVLDREPIVIRFDRALPSLRVSLDPGIQEWLSEVTQPTADASPPRARQIFVLLDAGQLADSERVSVVAGNRRIGMLGHSDGELFRGVLASGVEQGRPVVTQATQELNSSGLWEIRVYQPPPEEE